MEVLYLQISYLWNDLNNAMSNPFRPSDVNVYVMFMFFQTQDRGHQCDITGKICINYDIQNPIHVQIYNCLFLLFWHGKQILCINRFLHQVEPTVTKFSSLVLNNIVKVFTQGFVDLPIYP